MSTQPQSEYSAALAALKAAVDEVANRTWWRSPQIQSALSLLLMSESAAFRETLNVFDQVRSFGANFDSGFAAMAHAAADIARYAYMDENGAPVEQPMWAALSEWITQHNRLTSEIAMAAQRGREDISGELYNEAMRVHDARANAQRTFEQMLGLSTALDEADEQSRLAFAAAEEADAARRKSAKLAAGAGDAALSREFDELAHAQGRSAFWWTMVSVATTAVGISLGWFAHLNVRFETPHAAIVYPLLIAVGAAGLAAYFARLGGHHRHIALWAKGIAVQLQSYARFIQHVDDERAADVFEKFAGRVLGAPPPRGEKAAAQSASISELVALVSRNT